MFSVIYALIKLFYYKIIGKSLSLKDVSIGDKFSKIIFNGPGYYIIFQDCIVENFISDQNKIKISHIIDGERFTEKLDIWMDQDLFIK